MSIGNGTTRFGPAKPSGDARSFERTFPTARFEDEPWYGGWMGDPSDGIATYRSHDNVLLTRTFSNAYGLAGFRVGYAVGPEPIASARTTPPVTPITAGADDEKLSPLDSTAVVASL